MNGDPNKTQVDWTKCIVPRENVSTLRIPSGVRVSYDAKEDGIVEITETLDQYDEIMYASKKTILSKEVFVKAYNTYIKEDEHYEQ